MEVPYNGERIPNHHRGDGANYISLSGTEYFAEKGSNGNFILKHSVGHLPGNSEIDVPLTYRAWCNKIGQIKMKIFSSHRGLINIMFSFVGECESEKSLSLFTETAGKSNAVFRFNLK